MPDSVPGDRWKTGRQALADLFVGATTVRAAVAFVSEGGVNVLDELIGALPNPHPRIEIVARGAPVTNPAALVRLRDDLEVAVSVVGQPDAIRYHPKLWLIEAEDKMQVLSGSGNLTAGGLTRNSEQFEAWPVEADDVQEQRDRFTELTAKAVPLDRFQRTPQWRTWLEQQEKRKEFEQEVADLDDELIEVGDAEAELIADLERLYLDLGEAKLKDQEGKVKFPHGFRRVIRNQWGTKLTPVEIIESLCHDMTPGFERARDNNKLYLAAEVLAVEPTKKYHELIAPEIRDAAEQRLRKAEEEGYAPSGI